VQRLLAFSICELFLPRILLIIIYILRYLIVSYISFLGENFFFNLLSNYKRNSKSSNLVSFLIVSLDLIMNNCPLVDAMRADMFTVTVKPVFTGQRTC
jgi:hypothetical protein